MAHALAVSGLAKRYGSVEALKGVDLTVEEGELVGLLGPNGAGKSTLVKIACGLIRQTRGQAHICGAPGTGMAAEDPMWVEMRDVMARTAWRKAG